MFLLLKPLPKLFVLQVLLPLALGDLAGAVAGEEEFVVNMPHHTTAGIRSTRHVCKLTLSLASDSCVVILISVS